MIKTTISLQELRTRIGERAKSSPTHRFWGLFVHVQKSESLHAAYLEAKKNNGVPGVDDVSFAQVEREGRNAFIENVRQSLVQGTYKPSRYRKVSIPKERGKVRIISVPTIRDRIVQGAIKLILEPIFEVDFSDSSFGARPARSAHQAMDRVRHGMLKRRHVVADVDLACFFDNLTHHVLLSRIARRVNDPDMLRLLKQFFKGSGKKGVPQGSPLSPLIANVALTNLDNALDRGREVITYVRYLDDIVVLGPDTPKGRLWVERAMQRIEQEAEAIGVKINGDKTRMVTVTEPHVSFCFLGFTVRWDKSRTTGRWCPYTEPSKKSIKALKARINRLLAHCRHYTVANAVGGLNAVLRGWVNYFCVGNSRRVFSKVRSYAELSVRRFAAKQRKRKGFGWNRWNNEIVYKQWKLYDAYEIRYFINGKVSPPSKRIINPVR